jgi:glycosyltransferase involved in cell wall biosynthesis
LNCGARLATTKYILFTDIDIVYENNFVEEALNNMQEDVFLISDTLRVPQGFNEWSEISTGSYKNDFQSMKGRGIACYTKAIFEEIGGFDEQFAYWGDEDNDIAQRMIRNGVKEVIASGLITYHQWHPRTSIEIPYSLIFHNTSHYHQNIMENLRFVNHKQEWGRLLSSKDRPVYQYVDPENSLVINSKPIRYYNAYDVSGIFRWMKEIESFEHAIWAVPKNRNNNAFIFLVNKFLRRLDIKLDNSISYLDDFAQGLAFAVPGFFQDYYLDCKTTTNRRCSIYLK